MTDAAEKRAGPEFEPRVWKAAIKVVCEAFGPYIHTIAGDERHELGRKFAKIIADELGEPLPEPSPPTTEQGLISLNAAQEACIRDWATKPIERWHNSEVRFINLSRFAQCILQEQSKPEPSPPSAAPPYTELCRLSRIFNNAADLRIPEDARINDWLKAQIAHAKEAERVAPQPAPNEKKP